MKTRWLVLIAAVGVLASALGWAAVESHEGRAAAEAAQAAPEDAIAAYVTAAGNRYAGDCDQTSSPRDRGAVCSRFVEEQQGIRAYLAGRTFSEFDSWLFVEAQGGSWSVIASAPLDFLATTLTIPWPR